MPHTGPDQRSPDQRSPCQKLVMEFDTFNTCELIIEVLLTNPQVGVNLKFPDRYVHLSREFVLRNWNLFNKPRKQNCAFNIVEFVYSNMDLDYDFTRISQPLVIPEDIAQALINRVRRLPDHLWARKSLVSEILRCVELTERAISKFQLSAGRISENYNLTVEFLVDHEELFADHWGNVTENRGIRIADMDRVPWLPWKPQYVSLNPNADISIVKRDPGPGFKHNWRALSVSSGIFPKDIEDNPDLPWSMFFVALNPNLTSEFVVKHLKKFNSDDLTTILQSGIVVTSELVEAVSKKFPETGRRYLLNLSARPSLEMLRKYWDEFDKPLQKLLNCKEPFLDLLLDTVTSTRESSVVNFRLSEFSAQTVINYTEFLVETLGMCRYLTGQVTRYLVTADGPWHLCGSSRFRPSEVT